MEVQAFVLADHAEVVKGKLYMTGGGWDRLTVADLPAKHPHLSLAVVLVVPWNATNQRHSFQIDLVNADGKQVGPDSMSGEFEVGRPAGMRAGDSTTIMFVLNLNSLELSEGGTHQFVLQVNGDELKRASFNVVTAGSRATTG